MKKLSLLFILNAAIGVTAMAQTTYTKSRRVSANTIVKDSSGMVYPYAIWQKLVMGGDYELRAIVLPTSS